MKSQNQQKGSLAACICMGIGLFVSCLVALRLYSDDEARIREEFGREMDGYASAIDEQISKAIAILHSIKGLFDASEIVTRAEFNTFTTFLLIRYPSMRAVGWVPRVQAHERRDIEMQAQEEGFDGFQISETGKEGRMVRAGERDEYYPVYYIEPLAGNEAALSYDLASNPARHEALYAARDTGDARATSRIILVQETANEWAVLIFVPVYHGKPTSTVERRASIHGIVSGVFRLHDILTAVGAHIPTDNMIDMRLVDEIVDEDDELLHDSRVVGTKLATAYRYEKCLNPAGGRHWMLIATPSAAYISTQRTDVPFMSFLVGALMSGWISYYLARLTREKMIIEQQVDKRTQELREQGAALVRTNANLAKGISERRLLQQRITHIADHEQRRLGHELHDSLGQQIAVTAMLAQSLQERLDLKDEPGGELLKGLTESARNAQAQVRALSKGLVPAQIDPGGLKTALERLSESTKGLSDVAVLFRCETDTLVNDSTMATHLYRIAQEALRNSLEHGRVTTTTISLSSDENGFTLAIRDDGKGFNEEAATSSGAGLSSMRHRAELIGATLEIESSEKDGTSVTCCLPNDSRST
jgi:signal transduction histidine kinase/sensor domain CHASE-containing protein